LSNRTDGDIAVVVGANGGIGRALFASLRHDPRYRHVVGVLRHRTADLVDDGGQSWIEADFLDQASLLAAVQRVETLGPPACVIVATGVLHGPSFSPEKSLRALNPETLAEVFAVNAIGPALVAKHFLPAMPRDRATVFAALSARVGSIADNARGGWYGYRASKAALNMIIRTAAIEHARSHPLGLCVAIHPGTVATPLSQPFVGPVPSSRVFTPQVAATQILRVLDGLGPEATGGFYAWDGAEVPW
jgi:NAD(P)-dependent dehydrogenase (short-subunit alcohol dehydrogenase family)